MTYHEFGTENKEVLLLLQPENVLWDIFDPVIPELSKKYHLIIPAFPGFDRDEPDEDFTSVEDISHRIEDWMNERGYGHIKGMYGLSLGGSVVIKLIANHRQQYDKAVIDGGITPVPLPPWAAKGLSFASFVMTERVKHLNGEKYQKYLDKQYAEKEYTEEHLKYLRNIQHRTSLHSNWHIAESTYSYILPNYVERPYGQVRYWYGEKEKKERQRDLKLMKTLFPHAKIRKIPEMDHGTLLTYHPQDWLRRFERFLES